MKKTKEAVYLLKRIIRTEYMKKGYTSHRIRLFENIISDAEKELESSIITNENKRFNAACVAMQGILSSMPHSKKDTIDWLESIITSYGNIPVGEAVAREAFMYADHLLKHENDQQ